MNAPLKNTMQILISSHINYYQLTLPPLLASLSASGCPADAITVVVGGMISSGSMLSGSYDCNMIPFKENNWEYTALNWKAQQRQHTGSIFLLHDTCIVSPSFWNNVSNKEDELTKMVDGYSFNIGCYPIPNINGESFILKTITNKQEAIRRVDFIFNRKPIKKSFGKTRIEHGLVDFYKTGILRWMEEFPDCGVTKFRANDLSTPHPINDV